MYLFLVVTIVIAGMTLVLLRLIPSWAWINEPKWPVAGVLLAGTASLVTAWLVINPGASPGPASPPQPAASAGQAPRELVEVPAWGSMETHAGPPAPTSVPARKQVSKREAPTVVNSQATTLVGMVQAQKRQEQQRHVVLVRAKKRQHQRLHHLRKQARHFWKGYCYWWRFRHDACSKPQHAIRRITDVKQLRRSVRFWRYRRNHVKARVKAWRQWRAARYRVAPPVYSAPVAPSPVLVVAPKPQHRATPMAPYTPPAPVATAAPAPPPSSGGVSAPSSGGAQAPSTRKKRKSSGSSGLYDTSG